MVAAHIVEATQHRVISPHYYDRFSGNAGGNKLARLFHLVDSPYHLPRFAENRRRFEFRNPCINVPGRGDGRSIRQCGFVVVPGKNFLD
jgi:hypothetical protein